MSVLVQAGPVYRSFIVIKAVRAGYNSADAVMQKTGLKRSLVTKYLQAGYEAGLLDRRAPKRQRRGSEPFYYWMP